MKSRFSHSPKSLAALHSSITSQDLSPDIENRNKAMLGGDVLLTFHHLQPGIKLMAAGNTPDTIGFDNRFVIANTHSAAIRASRQMQHLVLKIFIPRAA